MAIQQRRRAPSPASLPDPTLGAPGLPMTAAAPSPQSPPLRAMILYLLLLGLGALVGGSIGFRLRRTYERVRPRTSPRKKSGKKKNGRK